MSKDIEKLRKLRKQYEVGKPEVSDSEYDLLWDRTKKENPTDPFFKEVGSGGKVQLPVTMGSLEKRRPSEVRNWAIQLGGEFLITPKLDGLSILIEYKDNKLVGAYTRGDGTTGVDVLSRVKHCSGIPEPKGKIFKSLLVRGELVCFKEDFKRWQGESYKTPRNFTVGVVNTKKPDLEKLQSLTFVAFNAWGSELPHDKIKQLFELQHFGFIPVFRPYKETASKSLAAKKILKQSTLPPHQNIRLERLIDRKLKKVDRVIYSTNYMDGLLKTFTQPLKVGFDGLREDNLIHAIKSFKEIYDVDQDGIVVESLQGGDDELIPTWMTSVKLDQAQQDGVWTTCSKIEWTMSARGLYKPTAHLEPVELGGVTISKATAHNLDFVLKNKLSKGARVEIIRSGDVIPYIREVEGGVKPLTPKKCSWCDGDLQKQGVDLACVNEDCEGLDYLKLEGFFSRLGLDGFGNKTIEQLFKNGYDTPLKILSLKEKDLLKIEGFQDKKSTKLIQELKSCLAEIAPAHFMFASGEFAHQKMGMGKTKLKAIVEQVGLETILKNKVKAEQLLKIDGIGEESSRLFLKALPKFLKFYGEIADFVHFKERREGTLSGLNFVFTGFRNQAMEKLIESEGGSVKSSVSKATNYLFAVGGTSTKMKRAKELGIPVILGEEAAEKFLDNLLDK
jgi:DNA ligase (NAD+)